MCGPDHSPPRRAPVRGCCEPHDPGRRGRIAAAKGVTLELWTPHLAGLLDVISGEGGRSEARIREAARKRETLMGDLREKRLPAGTERARLVRGDVRPDRRPLRIAEHGDDRGAQPSLEQGSHQGERSAARRQSPRPGLRHGEPHARPRQKVQGRSDTCCRLLERDVVRQARPAPNVEVPARRRDGPEGILPGPSTRRLSPTARGTSPTSTRSSPRWRGA